MLAINSVLKCPENGGFAMQRIVVLWVAPDGRSFWGLDLEDDKSWPRPFNMADTLAQLDGGVWLHDAPNFTAKENLSERQIAVRDERWAAVRTVCDLVPDIYDPCTRAALIRSLAETSGWTLNTSRAMLQRYWRGGMTPMALAPEFARRGAAGKMREPGQKKLGRPRSVHREKTGVNLTKHQRQAVARIARSQFRRDGKRKIRTCYRVWLDRFFFEDGIDQKGSPARIPRAEYEESGVPTFRQFQHHYYKLVGVIESARIREPRKFALQYRPLSGTATAETWGPGSRFQIDATMADIYLVSRDDRTRIVGRPVVYVIIDVWSRLIVGLYVAIEDASWTSAMMALANAAGSKVAYCAEHGIDIEEEEWPAANIGARLLSDHGEVDGKTAANLALHFNRVVEAAAAFRGDLKGLVETQFNSLQVEFGQFAPGYVAKDYGMRGARDYRLDATLDISEFTATMIDIVLARNSTVLENYDRDQGMPAGIVELAPIELWHWGVVNRSGRSQAWPEEYVRFRLLPTAEVSVDRRGISFQGRSYIAPRILDLMSKARMGRSSKVTISFDPRTTDAVYFHVEDAEHGFEVCTLHEASRAYAGRTCVEADFDRQIMVDAWRDAETKDVTRKINVAKRLEARIADAEARKATDVRPKSHRIRDIRENRRDEKRKTQADQAAAFRPDGPTRGKTGEVVPFRRHASEDLSESSLNDFMGD